MKHIKKACHRGLIEGLDEKYLYILQFFITQNQEKEECRRLSIEEEDGGASDKHD